MGKMLGKRKSKSEKRKPVGNKPISWPLESQRSSTLEGKYAAGATLCRISISWPLNSATAPASTPLYPCAPTDDDTPRSKSLPGLAENDRSNSTSMPSSCNNKSNPGAITEQDDLLSTRSKSRTMSEASTKRGMSLASILREGKPSICSLDQGGYCHSFDFESPCKLPSAKAWELAADVSLFDDDGNSRPFRTIYTGPEAIGEQQLIIFVRHFFCKVSDACMARNSKG
jgi:hypothetical protein